MKMGNEINAFRFDRYLVEWYDEENHLVGTRSQYDGLTYTWELISQPYTDLIARNMESGLEARLLNIHNPGFFVKTLKGCGLARGIAGDNTIIKFRRTPNCVLPN